MDAEFKRHRPRGHDVSCPYGAGAPPPFFVSVHSTGFNVSVSSLESIFAGNLQVLLLKDLAVHLVHTKAHRLKSVLRKSKNASKMLAPRRSFSGSKVRQVQQFVK